MEHDQGFFVRNYAKHSHCKVMREIYYLFENFNTIEKFE